LDHFAGEVFDKTPQAVIAGLDPADHLFSNGACPDQPGRTVNPAATGRHGIAATLPHDKRQSADAILPLRL